MSRSKHALLAEIADLLAGLCRPAQSRAVMDHLRRLPIGDVRQTLRRLRRRVIFEMTDGLWPAEAEGLSGEGETA